MFSRRVTANTGSWSPWVSSRNGPSSPILLARVGGDVPAGLLDALVSLKAQAQEVVVLGDDTFVTLADRCARRTQTPTLLRAPRDRQVG
jgi:hypothetical protein